jgi:hypothetical protein
VNPNSSSDGSLEGLATAVELLVDRVSASPREDVGVEVREGLLQLDELLEDWLVVAEATDLLLKDGLRGTSRRDDGLQELRDWYELQEVSQQQYGISTALMLCLPGPEGHREVMDRLSGSDGGKRGVPRRRLRRLLDIYAPEMVEPFSFLLSSRRISLIQLTSEAINLEADYEVTVAELSKGYADLLIARRLLRDYIRRTYPAQALSAPRPQNVNVYGGVVGNIGDFGTSTIYPQRADIDTE